MTALLATFLAIAAVTMQPARADDSNAASVKAAADWIASTWKNSPGEFFDVSYGVMALSAAEAHPETVKEMITKLRADSGKVPNLVNLALLLVAADAAGQNPRTFLGCGRDLIAELKTRMEADHTKATEDWGPYLIAIALSRSGEPVPDWIVKAMTDNQQGGFGTRSNGSITAEPEYTGLGISAMNLVSKNSANSQSTRDAAKKSLAEAMAWAKNPANQKTDTDSNHYWSNSEGSSIDSTGILSSALAEVGENIDSPVAYLKSQQAKTGVGAWPDEHDGTKADVSATVWAIMAPAGKGLGTIRSTQVPELQHCDDPTPTPTPTPTPPPSDDSNAASVKAAADWIADAWKKDPGKFSISRYTADGIMALSAAEVHPETVKEMIT
ncbi:hypothetical protein, partial [Arachnia propionica]|uniref:hypothetical protein n=1 Tax=Arachnia propionica TaxID=1750 RepID=UPI003C6F6268